MKFTLKDYQEDAVGHVLKRLSQARDNYQRHGTPGAFSLSATTGAGKTVMAAAVIEALLEGNDDFDFEADPGAVILWFTDDPSLNEQTRDRLRQAADRVNQSRVRVIENSFNQARLQAGHVYFLNAQKLSANSLLVRDGRGEASQDVLAPMPDARAYTLWHTIRNTIEDENLTLYLILDEAHRGMRPPNTRERNEKQTIVTRLINGADGVPPIPIVWGISATVGRFDAAMAGAANRTTYPPVVVDPVRVQESGLLKNDLRLDFPAEAGEFDTVLLQRGVRKIIDLSAEWADYAAAQEPPLEPVVPLLVVQMPNKPSDELLMSAFATIREAWPDLPSDAMAHVFGDHAPIDLGPFYVPYVSPEKVQDRAHIRVLFAKDAISTGWDCPRAEVLVSFRPASDETHITQLLGRMVRTPLARSIPGNDRLNSVDCVLPHFDRVTATSVAQNLLGERPDGGPGPGPIGPRVLYAPVDMDVNGRVPEAVWEAFDQLPSQALPRRVTKPMKRLSALAQALSTDELRPYARRDAYERIFAKLDGLTVQYSAEIAAAERDVRTVEGETITSGVGGVMLSLSAPDTFIEAADERAIEADFKNAGRIFSADLARAYAEHVAAREFEDEDDDGLLEAHIRVAALAKVPAVSAEVDAFAAVVADEWLAEYRVGIRGLSDERRAVYDEIRAMAALPTRVDVTRPIVRTEETAGSDGSLLPTVGGHLMAGPDGQFPVASLNAWETAVLQTELARPDAVAWYRNPGRASSDSLAVAYEEGGLWRRLCPDFVFFTGSPSEVRVSIVDPHGLHLADALPKLRGLAAYAESYGPSFHRIDAVADLDGRLRVLDLLSPTVRDAISSADDAEALYASRVAVDYR